MLVTFMEVLVVLACVAMISAFTAKMWNNRPVKKGPTMFPGEKK